MGCKVPVVERSLAGVPDRISPIWSIELVPLGTMQYCRIPGENELSILRQDVVEVPSFSARRAFHGVQLEFTAGYLEMLCSAAVGQDQRKLGVSVYRGIVIIWTKTVSSGL
jgi:hypothetical protein